MSRKNVSAIEKLLVDIASDAKSKPKKTDFEPPERAQKDASTFDDQTLRHRETLLQVVLILSFASFVLLTVVILFQMWKRLSYPDYTGVSDSVMKILATAVFGQVIAVVATIAKQVWKK